MFHQFLHGQGLRKILALQIALVLLVAQLKAGAGFVDHVVVTQCAVAHFCFRFGKFNRRCGLCREGEHADNGGAHQCFQFHLSDGLFNYWKRTFKPTLPKF